MNLINTTGFPFFVIITSSFDFSISATICVALCLSSDTVKNFMISLPPSLLSIIIDIILDMSRDSFQGSQFNSQLVVSFIYH